MLRLLDRLDPAASQDLEENLKRGLSRVASVVDGASDHDYLAARSIPWELLGEIISRKSGRIPAGKAFEYFLNHISSAPCRHYKLGGVGAAAGVLGYAYTANNQREFCFLQDLLDANDISLSVVNVCEAPRRKTIGVSIEAKAPIVSAVRALFESREEVAPGMLQAACKYAISVQGALTTLRNARSRKFVVANDHSPAPVAYAAVARTLGSSVAYLQHAEVSEIFPPLDFDLSILRSRHAVEIYESIGASRGRVVVTPRAKGWVGPDDINQSRVGLINADRAACVIYPSSVAELSELKVLVAALRGNDSLVSVQLKLHPRSQLEDSMISSLGVDIVDDVPDFPHIAVCGNSSIVVELFESGNVVFQFAALDRIRNDYYGFIDAGLSCELALEDAEGRFWRNAYALDEAEMSRAAAYVPRIAVPENICAARSAPAAVREMFACGIS